MKSEVKAVGFVDEFILNRALANLFGLKGTSRMLFFALQNASRSSSNNRQKNHQIKKKEEDSCWTITYIFGNENLAIEEANKRPYSLFKFQQIDWKGNKLGKGGDGDFPRKVGNAVIQYAIGSEKQAIWLSRKYPNYGIKFEAVNKSDLPELANIIFV